MMKFSGMKFSNDEMIDACTNKFPPFTYDRITKDNNPDMNVIIANFI